MPSCLIGIVRLGDSYDGSPWALAFHPVSYDHPDVVLYTKPHQTRQGKISADRHYLPLSSWSGLRGVIHMGTVPAGLAAIDNLMRDEHVFIASAPGAWVIQAIHRLEVVFGFRPPIQRHKLYQSVGRVMENSLGRAARRGTNVPVFNTAGARCSSDGSVQR